VVIAIAPHRGPPAAGINTLHETQQVIFSAVRKANKNIQYALPSSLLPRFPSSLLNVINFFFFFSELCGWEEQEV
jgi:hypothetical protein